MKSFFSTVAGLLVISLFGGCTKNISSNEYSEAEAGSVKQTYRGIVLNVRTVKVQGGDSLQDNTMGLVGGGLGGALLGSQFGKGRGSVVGGVLGAAAGALGGSMLEKKLKEQDGVEYTVEISGGRVMTIVQGPEPRLQAGQAVLVMVGDKGRSRVVADQSGGMTMMRGAAPQSYGPAPMAQQPMTYNNSPAAPRPVDNAPVYAQQPQNYGPAVDAVDQNHRDLYARDAGERVPGRRIIVQ